MDAAPVFPFVTAYHDALSGLTRGGSINEKLALVHREVKVFLPFIDRIAVAIYEPERDLLKTFVYSADGSTPLQFYQSPLGQSGTLSAIAASGEARVVNDLSIFENNGRTHSERLGQGGYCSSYTVPFYDEGVLAGFVFMNSRSKNVFSETVCHDLSPFVHLIGLLVLKEMSRVKALLGSISSALELSHRRDPETGAHLERMSRYARLIANELAPRHGLDDEYVEFIYRFAPLHDIGKIAVPDRILLKPGRLDDTEFAEMKRHARAGQEMMGRILENLGLQNLHYVDMLRHCIELHHEAVDGSGYPHGLKGEALPLAARIISVADVFDALTSARPYKRAWSNAEALAELNRVSGTKLDPECVAALEKNLPAVEEIQRRFKDEPLG